MKFGSISAGGNAIRKSISIQHTWPQASVGISQELLLSETLHRQPNQLPPRRPHSLKRVDSSPKPCRVTNPASRVQPLHVQGAIKSSPPDDHKDVWLQDRSTAFSVLSNKYVHRKRMPTIPCALQQTRPESRACSRSKARQMRGRLQNHM